MLPFLRQRGLNHAALAGSVPSSLLGGLAAYYPLSNVLDSGPNGLTLTNNNSVTFATGKVGNAASLVAASSQYLSLASNANVQIGGGSFTLAGWFYANATGLGSLFGKQVTYHLFTRSTQIEFRVFDGSFWTATKVYTQAATTWYFLTAWYDSATRVASVDINNSGSPATVTTGTTLTDDGTAFAIGLNVSGFGYLNGLADEVGLWKRVLTPTERTALYNAGAGRTHPFTGT